MVTLEVSVELCVVVVPLFAHGAEWMLAHQMFAELRRGEQALLTNEVSAVTYAKITHF